MSTKKTVCAYDTDTEKIAFIQTSSPDASAWLVSQITEPDYDSVYPIVGSLSASNVVTCLYPSAVSPSSVAPVVRTYLFYGNAEGWKIDDPILESNLSRKIVAFFIQDSTVDNIRISIRANGYVNAQFPFYRPVLQEDGSYALELRARSFDQIFGQLFSLKDGRTLNAYDAFQDPAQATIRFYPYSFTGGPGTFASGTNGVATIEPDVNYKTTSPVTLLDMLEFQNNWTVVFRPFNPA